MEKKSNVSVFYRGHADKSFLCQPSLFRDAGHRRHEDRLLMSLVATQPDAFSADSSTFERLVRAQHYSLPTRLLDISSNPLIALYFSVCGEPNADGEVIAFACEDKLVKFFGSDSVSILSNLAYLKPAERNVLRKNMKSSKDHFNSLSEVNRLVCFIKEEKPYFTAAINPADLSQPVFVKPKLSNRRIVAQNGAFIVFGLNKNLDSGFSEKFITVRINIPALRKAQILSELDRLGINEGTVFPDLEKSSVYIKSKYKAPLK
ncbi:FRG domain-containing protein [Aerophototrophica crusticola]|uniref:FRG domain-containing protein n=1 Tax=Aerophototrophica crusticola TaxID=1709002 RepID=A0A858RAR7_9PROT|nr:FRG domain-containing protein [Rhodospirillaceae bacterium B3]